MSKIADWLKGFSNEFWVANTAELLERAAYYGVFVVLTLYLSRILGFDDIQAAWLSGAFSASLYFLPAFSGTVADTVGFRPSLMAAFLLLSVGYLGLAILPEFLETTVLSNLSNTNATSNSQESSTRWLIVPILIVISIGGSFVKAIISATVAKTTHSSNRARGFSIFYLVINIGAFSGKTVVKPLRESMGDAGLVYINYFAASMTLIAFFAVWYFFKSSNLKNENRRTLSEVLDSFRLLFANKRLMLLILIITGFWIVQHQLYATMPKYVLRMAGESASPSWYANVNPLVVILTIGLVTKLMSSKSSLTSMTAGMLLMPLSALLMASGALLNSDNSIMGMHPIAFMMVVGIVFQGLAESFISPRFLEFFSFHAPKGEEGLYLGFSHFHSFLSSLIGFGLSGYLLDAYCPAPSKFGSEAAWQAASANAHYIWIIFAVIASVAAITLFVFSKYLSFVNSIDELPNHEMR